MARYEIAGLSVEMESMGRTARQAAPYAAKVTGEPDIVIRSDPERLLQKHPQLQDLETAQYMGTGSAFAKQLLQFNGFQLHASAVMLEGKAYLFSAPSGTGKSTHTEKWCRLFGAKHLNDDKPALRQVDSTWYAYGTPWSGKHDLSLPKRAVLGGIAFLRQGDTNEIRRMEPGEAVPMLLSQCLRFLSAEQMSQQLALVDQLLGQVPVWQLICCNEDAAAVLSHDAMTQQEG